MDMFTTKAPRADKTRLPVCREWIIFIVFKNKMMRLVISQLSESKLLDLMLSPRLIMPLITSYTLHMAVCGVAFLEIGKKNIPDSRLLFLLLLV